MYFVNMRIRLFFLALIISTVFFSQQKRNDSINKIIEKQIQEVEIIVKKKLIERKVDRLVFNVENSISATGGDAIDILKITPGIRVQNSQISMIGKSGMEVMVDERIIQLSGDDLINFLKLIKKEDIKAIEVISNPSAKYSAEGNSGLLNIKLKKGKENSWSASIGSSYQQSKYASSNQRLGFNYQKNKLTIASSLVYNNGSTSSTETQQIFYSDQKSDGVTQSREYSNRLAYKLGVDFKLNPKLTIGLLYLGSTGNPREITNENNLFTNLETKSWDQLLVTNKNNEYNSKNNSLNFHSVYSIDTLGRKLSIDADYFSFRTKQNQLFTTINQNFENSNTTTSTANNTGVQNRENYSVKIDMEHPFKNLSLNYGGRISVTSTDNSIAYYDLQDNLFIYNPTFSNVFYYKENTQALYASANKKLSEKWEIKLGLRMENTQTKGHSITANEIHKNNYSKFFPTGFVTFSPNDNHTFSLNYGKRINRPKYNWVNPFRIYYSTYSYYEGNPTLEPSYTHNIEISHIYKGNLSTSIYYSGENNGSSLLTILNPNSLTIIRSFYNYYRQTSYGLNENYTFNRFSWLESNLSGNISYSQTVSNNPNTLHSVNGWSGDISVYNSFIFNKSKTLSGNIDLNYSFPATYLMTKNKAVFSMGTGLQYSSLNKQLQITCTVYDLLRSNKQRWSQYSSNIFFSNSYLGSAPDLTLTISYKFGNNKMKTKDTKIGNNEESKRADL